MIVGIDPGQSGAIVWLTPARGALWERMPAAPRVGLDLAGLRDLLLEHPIRYCAVERAQAMPGQGIASTGSYLRDYGSILGILTTLRIPYETVPPATWHRELCGPRIAGETRTQAKARAARVVGQRLPELDLPAGKIVRAAVVDAACVALWATQRAP